MIGFAGYPALFALFGLFGLLALFAPSRAGSGDPRQDLSRLPRWALTASLVAVVAVAVSVLYNAS